eukprot:g6409.t1
MLADLTDPTKASGMWGGMAALAACDNVVGVELSVLCYTQAGWPQCGALVRAVHRVIELFGTDRTFFASNYPVDVKDVWPADKLFGAFRHVASRYPTEDQRKLFSQSARAAYLVDTYPQQHVALARAEMQPNSVSLLQSPPSMSSALQSWYQVTSAVDHAQQLQPMQRAPSALSPHSADGGMERALPRYIKFWNSATGSSAEAIFLAGHPIKQRRVTELLCQTLDLKPPNFILNLEAGALHPTVLGTDELVRLNEFDQWREFAEGQAQREGQRGANDEDATPVAKPLDMVNQLLFQKLVTVYTAVLDAAAMSNNWIVFDRTKSATSSATAELLVDLAMQHVSQAPVVLAIDSFERLERANSKVEHIVPGGAVPDNGRGDLRQLKKLKDDACVVPTDPDIDQKTGRFDAYSTHVFDTWDAYHRRDLDGDGEDDDVPLPCDPRPEHKNADGGVAKQRKWMYFYQSRLFASATHYVLLEKGQSDTHFPWSGITQAGTVCASGGTAAYKRLRDILAAGQPMVMLHNTGGVTQAFASLARALSKRDRDAARAVRRGSISDDQFAHT